MSTLIKFSLAVFVIILSSCSETGELLDEKIILYYNNGEKFCEGLHQVIKRDNGQDKYRKGIWKFYHLNGRFERIIEYDELGDIKNYKRYDENGNLLVSEIDSDKVITYLEFYQNGNIKREIITTIETEEYEDGEEFETNYETVKKYFKNGQLESQYEYINNEPQGKARHWDVNGLLIIEYEYYDGLIKSK